MTDYATLATNIKSKLDADAYFIANGVTVEKWERGFEVQGDDGALRVGDSDLPFAGVLVPTGRKSSEYYPREVRSQVPAEVVSVTTHASRQTGMPLHLAMVDAVEDLLESLKTSAANLGANTLVSDVASETSTFKKAAAWYFVTRTACLIDITSTY